MSSDVLQFSCSACQNVLTVPSSMAGISGPCPVCGHLITSPSASVPEPEPAPVPLFTTQAQFPPAATAPAPAFSDLPPVSPAFPPVSASSLGPVMPKPHSITQQLSPLGGSGAQIGGLGLGQGAEALPPSGFPGSGFSDMPPVRPAPVAGGFPGSAFGGGLPTPSGPLTNPFPSRSAEGPQSSGGTSGFPPVTPSAATSPGAGGLFPPAGFGPAGGSPFPTGESTAPVPGAGRGSPGFVLPGDKSGFGAMFGSTSPAAFPPAQEPVTSPAPGSLFVQPLGIEGKLQAGPDGGGTASATSGSFGENAGSIPFPSALTPQHPLQDSTPAWQQPGLGQTLLGGLSPAAAAPAAAQESGTAPSPPSPLPGGLPPRRPEGQIPAQGQSSSGSIWGALQPSLQNSPGTFPPEAFGSSLSAPAERSTAAAAPTHSSLIPGAPTLPQFGANNTGGASGASLLSREISSAPAAEPGNTQEASAGAGGFAAAPSGTSEKKDLPPSSATTPAAPGADPRKLKKPSRSSSILMFTLSILLLLGFLSAVGWMFRQPLVQIVKRIWPAPKVVVPVIPTLPTPDSTETETSPEKTGGQGQETASVRPGSEAATGTPGTGTAATSPAMPPVPAEDSQPLKKPALEAAPAMNGPDGIVTVPPIPPPPAGQEQPLPNPLPVPASNAPGNAKLQVPSDLAATLPSPSSPALTEVPTKPLTSAVQNGMSGGAASATGSEAEGIRGTEVVAPPAPKVTIQVSDEARPAADALAQFLAAGSFKERLQYTLGAEVMKPLMERYYESQPDGPVHVDSITLVRLDPKPQMGGGAHAVFGVESRSWEYPVPVMLEETKSGFKVDWLSFVEFKDRLLEKFFEGYQEGPARFHVGITRTHYFEDRVPNAENKDAFRISPAPPNPFLTTVFVEKDSQLGRELKERIPWGAQVWAIVDLEWVKLGSQQWVQLATVPQLNWYSVPPEAPTKATGTSATESSSKSTGKGKSSGKNSKGKAPAAPVEDEVQRAVPVGR